MRIRCASADASAWPTLISIVFVIQTEEVLGKDSAEELNKGNNPGPMTEIKFWDAKVRKLKLESWFDFCFFIVFFAVHQPRVPL